MGSEAQHKLDTPPASVWEGVYATFAEARGDAAFESQRWLDQIAAASQAPAAAISAEYILYPIAASMLSPHRVLRVLDFGGGMAPSFFALLARAGEDANVAFHVVDNEAVCGRARSVLRPDRRLTFLSELPGADERFDIVHAGSSLHYVEDWRGLLDRFRAYQPQAIIVADLPAGTLPRSIVTAQNYYGARIPGWLLRLDEFCAAAARDGYALAYKAPFLRRYFGRDIPPPMSALPPAYRLDHFWQFLFTREAA